MKAGTRYMYGATPRRALDPRLRSGSAAAAVAMTILPTLL
jgi:hypothetical protein